MSFFLLCFKLLLDYEICEALFIILFLPPSQLSLSGNHKQALVVQLTSHFTLRYYLPQQTVVVQQQLSPSLTKPLTFSRRFQTFMEQLAPRLSEPSRTPSPSLFYLSRALARLPAHDYPAAREDLDRVANQYILELASTPCELDAIEVDHPCKGTHLPPFFLLSLLSFLSPSPLLPPPLPTLSSLLTDSSLRRLRRAQISLRAPALLRLRSGRRQRRPRPRIRQLSLRI